MSEPAATRPTRSIVVTAVIIAVLGVLIVWSNGRDERSHASVGDVITAADPLARPHSSYVLLPSGRLDILATGALEDVDRDASVRAKQAPDDGSFIGLQITAAPLTGDASLTPEYRSPAITLTLVADGRRYPLGGDDDVGTSTSPVPVHSYVAVAGTPSRVLLEVGYETRAQSVDLRTGHHTPGAFASLYRKAARTVSCGAARYAPVGVSSTGTAPSCRVEVLLQTPYFRTLQWAPAGKAWLVTRVVTRSADGLQYAAPGVSPAGYKLGSTGDFTYGWNGRRAASGASSDNEFGSFQANVVVVPVPAAGTANGVLTVSAEQRPRLRTDSGRSSAPELENVTTTWRVQL